MTFWQWLDNNGCGALIALLIVSYTITEIARHLTKRKKDR